MLLLHLEPYKKVFIMCNLKSLLCALMMLASCSLSAQVIMPSLEKPEGETVYNAPQVKASMADPKTGRTWEDSLTHMVNFPDEIMRSGMQGRVLYRVIIEKDGSVGRVEPMMMMLTDATAKKLGVASEEKVAKINAAYKQKLVAEGLRCVKLLPPCKPAKNDGKNVRSFVTVSASFRPKK